MAATATPYGLRPVKRADGMPYAGATTEYLINPAGLSNNIFYGSVVRLLPTGYIKLADGAGANQVVGNIGGNGVGALGVFVGCEYVNAQGQVIHSQYYPSDTTGVVKAYVVDDPMVVFQAQLDAAGNFNMIGAITKFPAAQDGLTSGNTATGNSTMALDADVQTEAGAFLILGFANNSQNDAFPDVYVKFTTGSHVLTMNTGIGS